MDDKDSLLTMDIEVGTPGQLLTAVVDLTQSAIQYTDMLCENCENRFRYDSTKSTSIKSVDTEIQSPIFRVVKERICLAPNLEKKCSMVT